MLKAKHPDGTEHLATDVPRLDFDVSDPHEIDWRCPIDGCRFAFVDSEKRTKHFRHLDEYAHPSVSESPKHHYLKHKLHDYWNGKSYIENVTVEAQIGDQIADLLLVMQSGEMIVVEVQLSLQDTKEFKKRTRHYNDRNFAVLWLVGGEKYISQKSTSKVSGYAFRDSLEWLQKQYFGRFYSISKFNDGFQLNPVRYDKETRDDVVRKCANCGKPDWGYECSNCGHTNHIEYSNTVYVYDSIANKSIGKIGVGDYKPFVPNKDGSKDYEQFEIARFYDSKWWD